MIITLLVLLALLVIGASIGFGIGWRIAEKEMHERLRSTGFLAVISEEEYLEMLRHVTRRGEPKQ